MSYLVLARKWRPKTFSEVAGQEHVLRALVNALDNDRLHHAFLFSGTRGVGKTTLARIFAKSINCERGVSSTPCGVCSACVEIDQGRYVDLLEVDAASRTRVDDTRELLDNVQYAPTRGRYKVYLIDEVHMLSTHSFNALLKTLEEPPPHVKFLLATTDPQKLPVTVLSRCLQFNLKRLTPAVIQAQLERIAVAEGYEHEVPALTLLANAADGSMRDALSLLDQAIAHAGGNLARDAVADMLGTVERTHVIRLIEALASGDGGALMAVAAELAERGLGADSVLGELATACQQLALAQVVPEALEERVDDAAAVTALAARAPADAVQLWYQIAVHGRRDLPLAPTAWLGLEMTLLRMLAFRLDEGGDGAGGAGRAGGPAAPRGAGGKGPSPAAPAKAPVAKASAEDASSAKPSTTKAAGPGADALAPAGDATASADRAALTPPPASQEKVQGTESAGEKASSSEGDSVAATPSPPARAAKATQEEPTRPRPSATHAQPSAQAPASPSPSVAPPDWDRFAESLGASGMLRQLADNSVVTGVEGSTLRLQVDEAREHLLTRQQCSTLEQTWREQHGEHWRLAFEVGTPQVQTAAQRAECARTKRHEQAVQSLREDPYVKALEQTFGAQLLEDTVQARPPPAPVRKVPAGSANEPNRQPAVTPGAAVREAGARR